MTTYIRLRRANDWGHVYFARWPLSSRRNGFASGARGLFAHVGEDVPVLWPDGSETVERISVRREQTTVSDMGQSSVVENAIFGVSASIAGATAFLPLDQIKVAESWWLAHKGREDAEPTGFDVSHWRGQTEPPASGPPMGPTDKGSTWTRCDHRCACHPAVPVLIWDGERWAPDPEENLS